MADESNLFDMSETAMNMLRKSVLVGKIRTNEQRCGQWRDKESLHSYKWINSNSQSINFYQ